MRVFVFLYSVLCVASSCATPVLTAPRNDDDAVNRFPDFLWNVPETIAADGGERYQIQVDRNASFANPVIDDRVEIARYVPADMPLSPGHSYVWRVRALAPHGPGDWSETATFRIADYDQHVVEITANDSVDDVRNAFAQAAENAPATVRLMEDVAWETEEEDILRLKGIGHVWFDGNGKQITITRPDNRVFHILECENLLLSDFSVDFDPLPYVLCEITAFDPDKNYIIVRTVRNDANPCLELNHPLMLNATRTHMRLLDKDHPGAIKPGSPTYIHDGKQRYLKSYRQNDRLLHIIQLNPDWYTTDDFEIGDLMLRVARGTSVNIVRSANSRGICINNLTAYSSASQFVSSIDSTGFVVVNCSVARREGRYCSVTADSIYVRRNDIGPWIENCAFVANGDDCMNLHSVGGPVLAKRGSRTLVTSRATVKRMAEGDRVAVWAAAPGHIPPLYTTVRSTDLENTTVTVADPLDDVKAARPHKRGDTCIYNITKSNRRFYIKRNVIRNNARFGVLLSSQDGAVLNNRFERCASSAIRIGNYPHEGLNAANIVFRDNVFRNCGYAEAYRRNQFGCLQITAYGAGRKEVPLIFHRDIRFLHNRIAGWESGAAIFRGCRDVTFRGNSITSGGKTEFADSETENHVFVVENAAGITVTGNQLEDSRDYDRYIIEGDDVTGLQLEAEEKARTRTARR